MKKSSGRLKPQKRKKVFKNSGEKGIQDIDDQRLGKWKTS